MRSPTDPATDLLFVYGTLRRGSVHPMARWLASRAQWRGAASIAGTLIDCGPYPAAIWLPDARTQICGDLFQLRDRRRCLARLDTYEGITGAPGDLYRRIIVPVVTSLSRFWEQHALVYVLLNPPRTCRPVPSGDWLVHIAAQRAVVRNSTKR